MLPPAVLTWPKDAAVVQTALQAGQTVVLCIAQPPGTDRATARTRVRQALRSALGAWLDCPAADVLLQGGTGTPVQLASPPGRAGLSISHEEGLSLAAIAPGSSVGVDLLATSTLPDAAECLQLAQDYLGPATAQALGQLPALEVPAAFGQAWTAWEAGLKCAGQALREWSPGLAAAQQSCLQLVLILPTGYAGALARPGIPAQPTMPATRNIQ